MEVGEVRIINGKLSLIVSGQGEQSNFWWWRTIRKDGTLGKLRSGYNNNSIKYSRPIEHTTIIKVDMFDLLKVKE